MGLDVRRGKGSSRKLESHVYGGDIERDERGRRVCTEEQEDRASVGPEETESKRREEAVRKQGIPPSQKPHEGGISEGGEWFIIPGAGQRVEVIQNEFGFFSEKSLYTGEDNQIILVSQPSNGVAVGSFLHSTKGPGTFLGEKWHGDIYRALSGSENPCRREGRGRMSSIPGDLSQKANALSPSLQTTDLPGPQT